MKEGHFDKGTASLVESHPAAGEGVSSVERAGGDEVLNTTYAALEEKRVAMIGTPFCVELMGKDTANLTVPERFIRSNYAQAATFLRKAKEQLTLLAEQRAQGVDTQTQEGHIAQSLRIAETRLAEAEAAIPALPVAVESTPTVEVVSTVALENVVETENPTTEIIDILTRTLQTITKEGNQSAVAEEKSELIRLRGILIQLNTRYQTFAHDAHFESDRTVRDILVKQTLALIEKTKQEAEAVLSKIANKSVEGEDRVAQNEEESTPDTVVENPMVHETASAESIPPVASTENNEQYTISAQNYLQALRDVQVLRKMPARIIAGSKEFPEILANREKTLLELERNYAEILSTHKDAITAELQSEITAAQKRLTPSSNEVAPTHVIAPLEPEAQMDPNVIFNDGAAVEPKTFTFSHKRGVIDASPKSDDVVFNEVKNEDNVEAMETLMDAVEIAVAQSEKEEKRQQEKNLSETSSVELTLDTLKEYIQNYKGGSEAFQDGLTKWVDSIQDIHASRWSSIGLFGSRESHADAYSVLKHLTISQFRDIIKMPESARQSKFDELKIDSRDFEKWRREFTLAAMVDGLREIMHNGNTTFEEWARFSFAATKITEEQLAR